MHKQYAIGVDLGGTNLRAALVTAKGEIDKMTKIASGEDIMASVGQTISELMTDNVVGVGIGVAGLMDSKAKTVKSSPHLIGLDDRSFDELKLGVSLTVMNDASAAALGEKWLGAGKGFESFVLITLGTGIGGGYIHDGKLMDIAAEVGHMSVEAGGRKCPCGNYGCLELYASAMAMTEAAQKALEGGAESTLKECCRGNIYRMTPEDVYNAAVKDGDNLAREVLKDAGRYLGVGIANLINFLSPEAVILTGGLTGAWDIFIEEAVREASRRTLSDLFESTEVLKSTLDADTGGVLGAAAMVFDEKKHPRV